ncbi:hypothetical protein INS49_004878 [Diaporthe citri]|uniref:uncharacterized protein n=1 Tax=Diaporthe citri TaxID=83186 RepID=UPI001C80126A|nr:uncharacterized protein INS49_004878 [Diaporthe citri]KAG6354273.1 hypothetical protein INS49_004878 [Diaporthe citri]
MAGDCEIGSMQICGCINVGKNHIEARTEIAMEPENGTSDVKLAEEVCQRLLDQASSDVQLSSASSEELGADLCCPYKVKSICPKKGGTIWAEAYVGTEGHEYNYAQLHPRQHHGLSGEESMQGLGRGTR